ncbi:cellulose synthase operon protein YhjQ [Leclercia sp. 29361]|jgi:cellulose synthase operon protein YhjQ|uniref:cellulose biosynthesis protein BcsQ n=1 Tax=Leclercia TaxID=83654 RepID=UPI000D115F1E|nr:MULTISPECIES: cellulose biosynthesis protein BcsQ [Leclercia]MCT9845239.1 cellulose biosynthesis protein BcsQ [Leclercia adecarboxylata ATCC 23216 = NBRC 102595]PSS46270.1 cellulose synthase operon protein YhjQ [Enterobacter sp. FS01]MCU6681909.1 cellulose biosynthesis protein BcsQ [Leclercia tamurae]MDY0924210.1 cellulose biosynthesis protein BcsQ [Leclercia sp. CFBP8987]QIK15540.1 cellulose synthase operon protein YhjQ [Leclercia sp. 29361]
MPLVCICSPKGGVGKTTVTANLAYALARAGNKVLAIDFDVQNALRLHFGVPLSDGRGYVARANESADWSQSVLTAGSNMFVLPYGEVTEEQRLIFEHNLTSDSNFLARGLSSLLNYPGLIILADFPPGPNPALKAISPLADLHLVTLLADTASLSLLPHIENHRLTGGAPPDNKAGYYFLVNQSDNRRHISRDVTAFLQQRLGDRLLGVINRDESVPEANASQQSILDFSATSAAAFDIELVSKRIAGILGIQVGDGAVHANLRTSSF